MEKWGLGTNECNQGACRHALVYMVLFTLISYSSEMLLVLFYLFIYLVLKLKGLVQFDTTRYRVQVAVLSWVAAG